MTLADDATTPWIRRYRPNGSSPVRIVCFPHAGGSASFYQPVAARFAAQADVVSLQYPGRQDRRQEPMIPDIATLADRITAELRRLSVKPTVFFGHSMGAVLAFETALRLGSTGEDPAVVLASGRRAPSRTRNESVHQRDDEGIIAELKRLNGTAAGVLGDDEILRMSLPAIRNDYHAIENYRCAPERRVNCAVTVLTGASDPLTTAEEAAAWEGHTTGQFRVVTLPGGHFFLAEQMAAVNREIAGALAAAVRRPTLA